MKRLLCILLWLCNICYAPQKPMLGQQIDFSHPLARGLVGYWPMNEGAGNTVFDLSGHGNHAVPQNGLPWGVGPDGPVLNYDGSEVNEYHALIASPSAALSFGNGTSDRAFSIAVWCRIATVAAETFDMCVERSSGGTSDIEWMFYSYSNDFRLRIFDSAANVHERAIGAGLTTGWHFLAATYDGRGGTSANQGMALYLDGVPASLSYDDAGTYAAMHNTGEALSFGSLYRANETYDSFMVGDLGSVAIWDRVLTAGEVASLCADRYQMFVETPVWTYHTGEAPAGGGGQVITIIISHTGPLAVILLLSAAFTFIRARKRDAA